jgi:hypothetical protein
MPLSAAQIRRKNFAAIVDAAGGPAEFGRDYDMNPDYIRQVLRGKGNGGGRNIGDRSARKIEALLGKPANWLDQLQPAPKRGARRVAEPSLDEALPVSEDQFRRTVSDDIQALRYVVGALFGALSATRPDVAAEAARILRTTTPPEFLDRGLAAGLLEIVDGASAAAQAPRRARRAAKPASA